MEKTIKSSLAYIGRNVEWLAQMLGVNRALIYRRLKDDKWTLPQLRMMRDLFNWKTLEG